MKRLLPCMRFVALLLFLCLAGCGVAPTPSSEAASTFEPPDAGPADLIEGLNGEAFMRALVATGFVCGEPQPFTTALQQTSCTAQATDVEGVAYEVVILGDGLSAIHSIDASVDQLLAPEADPTLSAGFLRFIAESAVFTGADMAAAQDWVVQNAATQSAQLELPGVTYNLRGPAELRALEIVATE